MSQEVDERVVKLSFDNAKFEKNVDKSIKSLHALNDSLKLEGAEKGFAEVEKASEQVDFDKMQGAVDKLQEKFSALEVVGITAMVRITNKAIDTGEKLVKSLSIDQVMSGWGKYAQKTASVQTIMNATGKSITKVNHYLDKLMWYSDETSYGFTDMTASLGQLTAAGGDIDKLIPMIMGIANATAYAGKGASEFSRVIYNLNQSYSQGYLNLMDWKSVELAGVATAELKQQLIDTGVQLGKIKEGDVTIGTFGSTLSKKWADKEVMETAFGKLAEFTEAVKELQESDPKTYSMTAKAIEALEDQYDEVTVKAFKAAQEAKSFTEAVDATKDAVSSGWMETFDILFGNYEEAKSFWSDLADEFWDIFAGGQDARNSWLKSAFDGGLDQLLDQTALGDVGDSFSELLQQSLIDNGKLTAEEITDAGGLQKAMEAAGITAQDLYDQIQMSLSVYSEAAKMSDKELAGYNVSRKTLEKTIAAYQEIADAIQNGEVNLEEYADQMGRMSGREHFFSGILNILEGIKSVLTPIREAFDEVFMTDGSPLYNLLKGFDNLTSKFTLSEETGKKVQKVFKGAFSVLSVGFKLIKTVGQIALAVIEALLGKLEPLTDLLLNVGAAFGDVFTELNERLNSAESVTDILDAVANAIGRLLQPLKDIFGAIRALVTGSSIDEAGQKFGTFGKIVNAVHGIFQNFGLGTISLSGLIGKALRVLGGIFYLAFDGVKELISKAFSGFQDAGEAVEDFKDNNLETLENVRDTVVSLPEKAGAAMKAFAGNVQSAFYTVADACKTGLSAILKFFHLEDGLDFYRTLSLLVIGALALAIWGVASALKALNTQVKKTGDAIKSVLANPVTDLLNSMKKAVDAWTAQHTTNNFVNVAKGISIAIGALSTSIYILSKIEDPMKAVQALGEVLVVLFGLVVAMKALAKEDITGLDSAKIFATMISFSAGLLAFSASIKGIVQAMKMLKYFNKDQMNNAVGGLMAIGFVMTAMVGVVSGLNYLSAKLAASSKIKMTNVMKGISGYLVVATALLEMAGVLYLIGNMDETKFQDAYGTMFAMSIVLEGMVGVMALCNHWGNTLQATSKNKLRGITDGISSFLVVASSMVVLAGATYLFSKIEDLDKGMGAMLGALISLAGAVAIMSRFGGKAKRMKAGAVSMLIISGALLVMAEALKRMNNVVNADDTGAGWAGITVNLILLGTAVALLGKHAPDSLAAAAAIAALGVAMIAFAEGIRMLTEVSVPDTAKGVIALGVALFALVGAVWLLPTATKGIKGLASACLMLSVALLLLTPAFKGLASLSLQQAAVGISSMVAMVAAMWAIGANHEVADGFTLLAANLKLLAKAFSTFAGGLIKLAAAQAIFTVLMAFAGPVCKAISESKDDIQQGLIDLVDILCQVIIQCSAPLMDALKVLIEELINGVCDLIVWAWSGKDPGTGIGGGIQGALHSLYSDIATDIKTNGKNTIWNSIESVAKTFDLTQLPLRLGLRLWTGVRAVGNTVENANEDTANATQKQQNSTGKAATATGTAAKNTGLMATNLASSATSTKEMTKGMIRIADDTGKIYYATAEQVEALQAGKITVSDLSKATNDTADAMSDLGAATNDANGELQNGVVIAEECKADLDGTAGVLGDTGNAIRNEGDALKNDMDTTVQEAVDNTSETTKQGGDTAGSNYTEEFATSVEDSDLKTDVDTSVQGVMDSANGIAEQGGKTAGNSFSNGFKSMVTGALNWFNNIFGTSYSTDKIETTTKEIGNKISGIITPSDMLNNPTTNGNKVESKNKENETTTVTGLRDRFLGAIADTTKEITEAATPTGTGKTSKSGSSSTKKTAAELITEKYKTPLEKNKQLREAADNGYELWLAENENTASAEELAVKRAENIQNDIDRQNERVNLAFQKYTELEKLGAQAESEAREAWNEYLSEKKDLADLKASQYTDLYKEANEKLDTAADTLEKEYDLATAKKEHTSTKREQHDDEVAYKKQKLDNLKQKEENARKQYEFLTKELGLAETDERVVQARQDLLDAELERQQLENELAKAQLQEIELSMDEADARHKRITAQLDRLTQVYGDGDLSARADDYQNAVETYGKNSAEAQKAKYEGTTSAILAAVTAFRNLSYQMQNTLDLEKKLNAADEKDKDDIREAIEDSESAFLGFAENLADAFNMDTYGKRAILKLANTLVKKENREYLGKKLGDLWNKATANNDKLRAAGENLAQAMGVAFSETGMEVGTECISTIVSLMQGDWANALVSAFNVMLDVMSNDQLQAFLVNVIADVGNGLDALGINFTNLAKLAKSSMGSEGVAGEVVESTGMIAKAVEGSGGLEGVISGIGAMLGALGTIISGFLAEFWPYILIAAAIVAAIAGIAYLFNKNRQTSDAGKDLDESVADGVTDNKDKVTDAIKDMTDDAVGVMEGTINTIRRLTDDEFEYEPCITPVVDLTNVEDSAAREQALLDTYDLSGAASRALSARVDAQAEIQNGAREQSNAALLNAVVSLGDRMDGVSASIKGMKLTIDGKRTIGYIDNELGVRAARKMR